MISPGNIPTFKAAERKREQAERRRTKRKQLGQDHFGITRRQNNMRLSWKVRGMTMRQILNPIKLQGRNGSMHQILSQRKLQGMNDMQKAPGQKGINQWVHIQAISTLVGNKWGTIIGVRSGRKSILTMHWKRMVTFFSVLRRAWRVRGNTIEGQHWNMTKLSIRHHCACCVTGWS